LTREWILSEFQSYGVEEISKTSSKGQGVSLSELFRELKSSTSGLSSSEAQKRLEEYGPNEIIEKKVNPIVKFLRYFWGPIPWMIEIAVILSAVIRRWEDFWIIFGLLLLNAFVGFWEERKGENAIELLKQKLAVNARVLRDGKWLVIAARELVPGDIARVRLGDIVPADIRLVHGDYLMVDQSALTGESLPVEKHVGDIGYAGSVIRQGEMNVLVVATGSHTYFGKTAKLVEEAKTESHLQKAIIKIGDYLIVRADFDSSCNSCGVASGFIGDISSRCNRPIKEESDRQQTSSN
jgi:H+-transporting ATPase